jgi:hypothetical protein
MSRITAPVNHVVGLQCQASTGTGQSWLRPACDKFLYGFKGAASARRAWNDPAQRDREMKARSAGEECVGVRA